MLEKTLAMIADLPACTFKPDDEPCFDDAEITALGQLLRNLLYAPSQLRRRLQDFGVSVVPTNFYSEVPRVADLEASFAQPSRLALDRVFRDPSGLRAELRSLHAFAPEFDPPLAVKAPGEFAWENILFSYSDAMAYYCMIRKYQPETIVEIGSGASTLIAQMACARNGRGRIVCLEPYPPDYLRRLPGVEIVEAKFQDIDNAVVLDRLGDGDFLFIDSTHTVKHDSDCLHIYLRLLPEIRKNVIVHAHDISLPSPLALEVMRDMQIYWTEQYLLYAYLLSNPYARVLYGSSYHSQANPEMLAEFMCGRYAPGGGSFWFAQSLPV